MSCSDLWSPTACRGSLTARSRTSAGRSRRSAFRLASLELRQHSDVHCAALEAIRDAASGKRPARAWQPRSSPESRPPRSWPPSARPRRSSAGFGERCLPSLRRQLHLPRPTTCCGSWSWRRSPPTRPSRLVRHGRRIAPGSARARRGAAVSSRATPSPAAASCLRLCWPIHAIAPPGGALAIARK